MGQPQDQPVSHKVLSFTPEQSGEDGTEQWRQQVEESSGDGMEKSSEDEMEQSSGAGQPWRR